MRTTVLVAPAGRGVGLTTACLGIVRALDREGIRVAFAKPVANREPDHTIPLLSLGAHFAIPPAVPRAEAEGLLAAGDDQTLMERVVAIADQAGEDVDVLIVEGMYPEMGMVHSTRVNALMLKALDAELVLVAAPSDQGAAELAETVAIAARGYGALSDGRTVGCILNRVCDHKREPGEPESDSFGPSSGGCGACIDSALSEGCLKAHKAALEAEGLRPIAIVPCNADLMAPRVKDIGDALHAQVLYPGEARTRRVRDVAICAMTVPNALKAMKPGTLVITPGDRSDILLAAAMTVQSGTPLVGRRPDRWPRARPARPRPLPEGLRLGPPAPPGPGLQLSGRHSRRLDEPVDPDRRRRARRADDELRRRPRRSRLGPRVRQVRPRPAPLPARLPPPPHRDRESGREEDRPSRRERAAYGRGRRDRRVARHRALRPPRQPGRDPRRGGPAGGHAPGVRRDRESRWPSRRATSKRSWRDGRRRG